MKKALITGGTKGIGRAIAQKFLEEGYEVIINYCHDEEAAIAAQNELNSLDYCPVLMRADVSDEKQVKDMFAEIYRIFGGIDVLVNNAGISKVNVIQDTTLADWEEVVGVNLRGVFLCCREAARSMVSRGRGAIVNIASIWGEVGASCEVAYSATKGGVIAFTKALAKELAPSHITVNCVSPGVIDTQMNDCFSEEEMEELINQIPLGRLGSGEDVAEAVFFAAGCSYVTGEVISVGGGFSK